MHRFAAILALSLAAALVALAPAAATARTSKRAAFLVTVDGTQTNAWALNYADPYGAACKGSGSEVTTFATAKPLRMLATRDRAKQVGHIFQLHPHDLAAFSYFRVHAKVERTASFSDTAGCSGGAPASNCTRSLERSWKLSAPETEARANWLVLQSAEPTGDDPFPDCYALEHTFPDLVFERDDLHIFGARLPTAKLFNRGLKRLVATAHGLQHPSQDEDATTTVDYTVRLKRVKK